MLRHLVVMLVLVSVVGGYLFFHRTSRRSSDAQPVQGALAPPVGAPHLSSRLSAQLAEAAVAPVASTDTNSLQAVLQELDFGPLAPEVAESAKRNKTLAAFLGYRRRIPTDEQDRQRYHAILSSTAELNNCRQELLYPADRNDPRGQQVSRLLWVDFLREASSWTGNPRRATLLTALEDILLTDNMDAGMAESVKQSLAANKWELYELLSEQDPERVARVQERSKGTRQEKLFAFFADQLEQAKHQGSPRLN